MSKSKIRRICEQRLVGFLVFPMTTCQANAALAAANGVDMPAEPIAPSVGNIDNALASHAMTFR